jgi:hypothetical protein
MQIKKIVIFLSIAAFQFASLASEVECDIIVAGGSLASLAAAVSAASALSKPRVCFLELTDWPGGQMTASGVPAIDFGPENSRRENLPSMFSDLLFGPLMPNNTNLGNCWVSKKCFNPVTVMNEFVFPLLSSFTNLNLFLRTSVSFVTRNKATGAITSVVGIRRTPKEIDNEWAILTSSQIIDWYDPNDSNLFSKESITFVLSPAGVVIEATEFGDVLATSGVPFAQGIESPNENSTTFISTCGQGMTIPFYATYGHAEAPSPDPWPPGNSNGDPTSQQGMSWDRDWTYRRVDALSNSSSSFGAKGETSVINVGGGNDIGNVYLFYSLDSSELLVQLASPGAWRGGINTSALAAAEQRAYSFYHFFKANASVTHSGDASSFISLNASLAGTLTGLAKMPYLRDTRRSAGGIGNFRIQKSDLSTHGVIPNTAIQWPDTIAIGQYFYADIHKEDKTFCAYPSYIVSGSPVLPYYIPFRSLTVNGIPNLIVVGKSLAMSFFANAAIRLHPEEWATGSSAGTIAALMSVNNWTIFDVFTNIHDVRIAIQQTGNPLNWTF